MTEIKISKNKRFVLQLIKDYNNDTETSLEYAKDFIFDRPNTSYSKWAPQTSGIYKNANNLLKRYNLKVCKGSYIKFCTLEPLFKHKEKIILNKEDENLVSKI